MDILKIKQAAGIAKSKTSDKRWQAAIDKAVAGVESGWIVTELVHGICVTTENGTYFANGACQCKAFANGQACKHRALARLIQMAQEADAAEQAARRCDKIIADIKNIGRAEIVAEIETTFAARFPGCFLADTVNALCGPYSISHLGVGPLTTLLHAIA